MAQQVVIAGALFNDVPSISVPDSNSVYHPFVDPSVTTAAASDVAQGKQFIAADGTLTQGTASGGGGASNFITGTFTGTQAGVLNINLPYTGNGYPVMVTIYPTEGQYNPNVGTFYNLVQRYVIAVWEMVKSETDSTPTYTTSGDENRGTILVMYKNSASNATVRAVTSSNITNVYTSANPSNTAAAVCKLKSKTSMSVYITNTSEYGFAQNIEYRYDIVYSS